MSIVERTRNYYEYEWNMIRELPGDDERYDTLYSLMLNEGWIIRDTSRGETYRQVIFERGDDLYDLTLCYC